MDVGQENQILVAGDLSTGHDSTDTEGSLSQELNENRPEFSAVDAFILGATG
jgi:hypothetical protein